MTAATMSTRTPACYRSLRYLVGDARTPLRANGNHGAGRPGRRGALTGVGTESAGPARLLLRAPRCVHRRALPGQSAAGLHPTGRPGHLDDADDDEGVELLRVHVHPAAGNA